MAGFWDYTEKGLSTVGDFWGAASGVCDDIDMGAVGGGLDILTGINKIGNDNTGGYGDIIAGGTSIVPKLAQMAGASKGTLDKLGPIGAVIGGGAQAVTNTMEAREHRDERKQGYWSNDDGERNAFWGAAGDAQLGGTHAILGAFAPQADSLLSIGEGVVDGVGMGAGLLGDGIDSLGDATGLWDTQNEWGFGAGDVVGMGMHGIHDLVNTLGPGDDAVREHGNGTMLGQIMGGPLAGALGAWAEHGLESLQQPGDFASVTDVTDVAGDALAYATNPIAAAGDLAGGAADFVADVLPSVSLPSLW